MTNKASKIVRFFWKRRFNYIDLFGFLTVQYVFALYGMITAVLYLLAITFISVMLDSEAYNGKA